MAEIAVVLDLNSFNNNTSDFIFLTVPINLIKTLLQ